MGRHYDLGQIVQLSEDDAKKAAEHARSNPDSSTATFEKVKV